METRLTPIQIQHIGNELAIAWSDGTESYLPLDALRRACPCAVCGGEPDVLGHVVRPQVTHTPRSFVLTGFQIIGSYALQPAWADGHGTGLYTFPFLRRVADASAAGHAP